VHVELSAHPRRYYHHGWQSWSLAAWMDSRVHVPVMKPYRLHPQQADPAFASHPRPHGSWVGAAEMPDGTVVLLGALGLDAHVELAGTRLVGKCESGGGEWLVASGSEMEVFGAYADALRARLGSAPGKPAPRVWSSWYSLSDMIDETLLAGVFDSLGEFPFDVLQVDDGWQRDIGDWEPNARFPAGMEALSAHIRATGRRAGLWLAPLIAARSSVLFHAHPEWFLRDPRGRLVSAGFNWGRQLYALNTTLPDVQDWLAALMHKVRGWGFSFLKLDFLYGGALPGVRQAGMSREMAFRAATQLLRNAMGPDAYFLACGAPILPVLGLCDALRIGPDVSTYWENQRDAALLHNPTTPGARNAIRTSLHRLWLRPLVQMDPDVAYFQSAECSLTPDQKRLLRQMALICGFRATSDLPQWLTRDEDQELTAFLTTTPVIVQTGPRSFRIDGDDLDYGNALALAAPATGLRALQGSVIGWLADQGLALWLNNRLARRAIIRKIEPLRK
jgi:alpha-galactosidase